jgi:hypothetical protein
MGGCERESTTLPRPRQVGFGDIFIFSSKKKQKKKKNYNRKLQNPEGVLEIGHS